MRGGARELREGIVAVLKKTAVDRARGWGVSDLRRNAKKPRHPPKPPFGSPSLEKEGINMRKEQYCFQELTVGTRCTRGNRSVHSPSETIFMRSNLHLGSSWTAPSFL